jgi:formylglycine-generating enzyme required for sulfatase activity
MTSMKRMTKRTWMLVAGMVIVAVAVAWAWMATHPRNTDTFRRVDLGNGVTMDFVWIPAGDFMMGSPTNEVGHSDDETLHQVKIAKGFWMGKYEVTQKQYAAVMGTNPSQFDLGGSYPVDTVSWDDAVAFCTKVKERAGLEMRLPTEAEWEYACRAGTTTAYYTGDTKADLARAGCFNGNAERGIKIWKWDRRRQEPRSVGWHQPNAWGLYDMHGNMWEWCADWYGPYDVGMVENPTGPVTGNVRVLRGGSWDFLARCCRSAYRYWYDPSFRDHYDGFRCVLVR